MKMSKLSKLAKEPSMCLHSTGGGSLRGARGVRLPAEACGRTGGHAWDSHTGATPCEDARGTLGRASPPGAHYVFLCSVTFSNTFPTSSHLF